MLGIFRKKKKKPINVRVNELEPEFVQMSREIRLLVSEVETTLREEWANKSTSDAQFDAFIDKRQELQNAISDLEHKQSLVFEYLQTLKNWIIDPPPDPSKQESDRVGLTEEEARMVEAELAAMKADVNEMAKRKSEERYAERMALMDRMEKRQQKKREDWCFEDWADQYYDEAKLREYTDTTSIRAG